MADPATFLAANTVLGTLFSSENSLFIHLWKIKEYIFLSLYYYLIDIVNVKILSLKFSLISIKLSLSLSRLCNGLEGLFLLQNVSCHYCGRKQRQLLTLTLFPNLYGFIAINRKKIPLKFDITLFGVDLPRSVVVYTELYLIYRVYLKPLQEGDFLHETLEVVFLCGNAWR